MNLKELLKKLFYAKDAISSTLNEYQNREISQKQAIEKMQSIENSLRSNEIKFQIKSELLDLFDVYTETIVECSKAVDKIKTGKADITEIKVLKKLSEVYDIPVDQIQEVISLKTNKEILADYLYFNGLIDNTGVKLAFAKNF